MRRNVLHLSVDVLLLLTVLGLMLTGLLIAFVLPPGQGGARVWGWTRHDWGDVHFWIAVAMLGAAVLHVILNWGWVCNVAVRLINRHATPPRGWRRNAAGLILVGLLVAVAAGFLWLAASAKVPAGPGEGLHGGRSQGRGQVRGWRQAEP